MRKALQPVYVNDISFDALIESTENYSATAPAYPTESGFSVSDTIIIDPLDLSMTLYVTNTPVTWKDLHGVSETRVDEVVSELVTLFRSGQIVTVETTDRMYTDMIITSLSIAKTSETGYAREIPITFSEVLTTETKTGTVPESYALAGETMASTGTAGVSGGGKAESNNKSILKNLESGGLSGAVGAVTDQLFKE